MQPHDLGTDPDIIDEEILEELLSLLDDGVPDDLAHAVHLFLTGVPARLAAIEDALAHGRLEAAAQVAHSLRGSAGAFGARGLGQLAGEQERLCGAGDAAGAAALLGAMHAQFATVEAVLRARLPGTAA